MISLVLAAVLAAEPAALATEHYDVRTGAADPAATAAILEQLHGQLAGFFGKTPSERLQVEVFADVESFHQALIRDGHPAVAAGGYYAPENRKVYLFVQPSAYFTRQLLLHEATHQFQFLASTGNRKPRTTWHIEGLAELFGMHNWNDDVDFHSTKMGRSAAGPPSGSPANAAEAGAPATGVLHPGQLRCGVVPAVSLEDYPAKALQELREHAAQHEWLGRVITGQTQASHPLSWALAHFLIHRDRAAFRDLVSRLDRDCDALESFRETFGTISPRLVDDLHRWVADHQQPWSVVWVEWQESGEAIVGASQTVGLIVHKAPLDRLQARIEPAGERWKAGGVFGFQNENDFHLVELSDSGSVRVIRRAGAQWQEILTRQLPSISRAFAIQRRGRHVAVLAADETLCELDAPGKLGLYVDSCRARFSPTTRP